MRRYIVIGREQIHDSDGEFWMSDRDLHALNGIRIDNSIMADSREEASKIFDLNNQDFRAVSYEVVEQ